MRSGWYAICVKGHEDAELEGEEGEMEGKGAAKVRRGGEGGGSCKGWDLGERGRGVNLARIEVKKCGKEKGGRRVSACISCAAGPFARLLSFLFSSCVCCMAVQVGAAALSKAREIRDTESTFFLHVLTLPQASVHTQHAPC